MKTSRALFLALAAVSILMAGDLLVFNGLLLPALRAGLAAAYEGRADPLVQLVFDGLVADPQPIELELYQGRLSYAYLALKTPLLVLLLGATGWFWLASRPPQARLAIRDGPQRLAYLLLWLLALALLVHAFNGTFSRFMADDYCSAAAARSMGVFQATIHWYRTWSGRFSASFLDGLAGVLGARASSFSSGGLLLAWIGTLAFAFSRFLPTGSKGRRTWISILWSAALVFFTLRLSFHLVQSLYWGQGMRTVLPPLLLCGLTVGLLRHRLGQAGAGRIEWRWALPAIGLTFVAAGFSETYAALQVAGWSLAIVIDAAGHRSTFSGAVARQAAPLLLGSLAGLVAVAVAPGNSVRLAGLDTAPGMWPTVWIAWQSTVEFLGWSIGLWSRSLALLATLLLSALTAAGFFGVPLTPITAPRPGLRVVVTGAGCTLLVLFASFLPAAYAFSGPPPGRTLMIQAFVLVCGIAYLGTVVGGLAVERSARSGVWASGRPRWVVAALVMLLTLVTVAQATYEQIREQRPMARYATAWDANERLVLEARDQGLTSLVVPALPGNWAGLSELRPEPDYWVNACAGQYFGIEIGVAPETDE